MNELIKVTEQNGKQLVSARDLHNFLENTDNVNTWFRRQAERAMLIENEDFTRVAFLQTSGQSSNDYVITLSSAKEIAMLNGGEKGKQARLYFIEIEKKYKSQSLAIQVPQNLLEALMLAVEQEKKIILQAERLLLQESTLKEQKPKVEFFDAVVDSRHAIDMNECAKMIGIKGFGRNNLFKLLKEKDILDKNNLPYQKYINMGLFRVIAQKYKRRGEDVMTTKTLVFPKGVDYIRKIVEEFLKCE